MSIEPQALGSFHKRPLRTILDGEPQEGIGRFDELVFALSGLKLGLDGAALKRLASALLAPDGRDALTEAVNDANDALKALGHVYSVAEHDGPTRIAEIVGHLAGWRGLSHDGDTTPLELYDAAIDAMCRLRLLLSADQRRRHGSSTIHPQEQRAEGVGWRR